MGKPGKLFVVSGPSGSGKSTLSRALTEKTGVQVSVSATTRNRGEEEVEGKDYFFLSQEEFLRQIKAGGFLEYAQVFGHYYGTPAGPVQKMLSAGQSVVLEIDVQGAGQVFKQFPEAEGILVLPPDEDELHRRLSCRGRDDAQTIKKRLAKAKWEIQQAQDCPNFKHVIVNENLQVAIEQIIAIVKNEQP